MNRNRKAAYAGSFYSADKTNLQNDLSILFSHAKPRSYDARAVISPHAGYIYSGSVAASAYNQINPDKQYDNVFILTASHKAYFSGAAIYNIGNYETPLGEVTVNIDLCNKLIADNPIFKSNPSAHLEEHSLEVQLPFLQYHLKKNFQIIPIIIGSDNASSFKQIAEALKPYFNENNLFVISTDFSHYPEYQQAINLDAEVAEAICSGNPEMLISVLSKYKNSKIKNLATNLCGFSAVVTLMYLVHDSAYSYQKIDYKNSGDSHYGDKEQVVGYWAISLIEKDETTFNLSEAEKIKLLEIARAALETKLAHKKNIDIQENDYPKNLLRHCGAFVTLHKNSNLRGCVGTFEPNYPLVSVVANMAVSAALHDTRFSPLTYNELKDIDIEISVLTPMKKISSIDEIVLGKHGIYIVKDRRSGTFLPQVAVETGWTKEEFLGYCARDKAGLSYTGWKEADIYTYEAIIFSEKELKKNANKIASFYEKLDGNRVECTLCPHQCILSEQQTGLCKVRQNINGDLVTLSYGKAVSVNIDPIEKKPLYHFLPASISLSFGTAGCNLHCKNCQNSEISQLGTNEVKHIEVTAEQIVGTAIKNKCKSISYTYTEPTIFYEFMLETAKLAKANGIKNIIVSNGYINEKPLRELIPYIDAANIDLKCFNDTLYTKITTATLQPVLNTLKLLKSSNVHLEITNLVIPGYTDDMTMISEMCDWLISNGFSETPLHFSRFFPAYKMQNVPSTPVATVEKAVSIAKSKGIKYVYLGNVSDTTNTHCANCGEELIKRDGYKVNILMKSGVCPKCSRTVPGIWE